MLNLLRIYRGGVQRDGKGTKKGTLKSRIKDPGVDEKGVIFFFAQRTSIEV